MKKPEGEAKEIAKQEWNCVMLTNIWLKINQITFSINKMLNPWYKLPTV